MRGENGLMDELRKLLKEGKLNFRQYFIVAFEVFKDMLKNDNKEIIILFTLYLLTALFTISKTPLLNMLSGIVSIVAVTRIWLFYKKVIFKIEERQYDSNGNFIKVFVLLAFSALVVLLISIMFMHYVFSIGLERLQKLNQTEIFSELKVPIIILIAVFLIIQICILYLIPIYMSRRGGFWESFSYNSYLSKGNRIRMFVPLVLVGIINFGMGQALVSLGFIGILVNSIVATAISIYKVILVSIIYLNVEYTSEIPEEFSYLIGKEEETYNVVEDKIEE
mgnify:CR=1 FL=1